MMPSLFSVINGVFFIRAAAGGGRRARLRVPGRRNKPAGCGCACLAGGISPQDMTADMCIRWGE